MRQSMKIRETNETSFRAKLDLDGDGESKINFPIKFFQHMLETLSRYALWNLELNATGDINVDQHHVIEDTGIVLGNLVREALGEKRGIKRLASIICPMDDALILIAIDFGGRSFLQYTGTFDRKFCGDFDLDLLHDFLIAFSVNLRANLVVKILEGRNNHHKIEAIFKGLGEVIRIASNIDPLLSKSLRTTKGVIE